MSRCSKLKPAKHFPIFHKKSAFWRFFVETNSNKTNYENI